MKSPDLLYLIQIDGVDWVVVLNQFNLWENRQFRDEGEGRFIATRLCEALITHCTKINLTADAVLETSDFDKVRYKAMEVLESQLMGFVR